MKRFLCILTALVLLVGIFALSGLALAEETTPPSSEGDVTPAEGREVTFNAEKFREYVLADLGDFYLEMDRSFMFENKWWEDSEKVHEIFNGINYTKLPEEDTSGKNNFKVNYVIDGAAEDAKAPDVNADGYAQTAHFELADAPKAAEGKFFNGWLVSYDGQPDWSKDIHYKAGDEIAIPAADVTITAQWVDSEDDVALRPADDVIYLLYVSPSGSSTEDMKNWSRCLVTSTLSLATEGVWNFRFAVVEGEKASETGYSFDYDDVLATTFDNAQQYIDAANEANTTVDDKEVEALDCTLSFHTKDTTHPQVALSTSQQNKVSDGLTVGTTYSVSTSLDITDCSSTTVTYLVYKKVGNDVEGAEDGWLLIYDSQKREVTEGYEDNISTGGVITPLKEDVTGEDVYKIVYSVVDSNHNYGVKKVADDEDPSTEEYHPVMLLKVNAAPAQANTGTKIETWKIILYVVAGLSALGIIILLFVKPKQQPVSDARYNANNEQSDSDNDNSNNQ